MRLLPPAARRRLSWQLRAEAWRSHWRLARLHDRCRGQRAVILCNGPSLMKVDFDSLAGVYTFGLNKINLLFDRTTFRPSCVVAVNPYVLEQNAAFYRATDLPVFLDSGAYPRVGSRPCVHYLYSLDDTGVRDFRRDVPGGICQGYTVTFVALQLAHWFGFTRVALVGCDHDFAEKGRPNAVVTAGERDQSHFDPRYFSGGMKWQLPDLPESERSYELARQAFAADGRELVNATEGGRLELLPRMSLRQFLAS
jgi:hypothetical protein